MKLKNYGAKQTGIEKEDGTIVFFSYETPVAVFIRGKGILRTSTKFSATTSRHITKWISDEFSPNVTVTTVDQQYIEELAE